MQYFCSKDCPDTCSFDLALSQNGKPIFTADKKSYIEHPFVCAKLRRFYEVESSETPYSFFREADGKKLETKSSLVIEKAAELINRHKDGRILFLRGGGNLSWRMSAWDALFASMEQVWFVEGSPCDETGIEAHQMDFSACVNPPVEQLEQAKTILLFGKNAKAVSPHLYVYLKNLAKKQTKIVVIDPVQTETSHIAERYIRIAPAGDGALCAALLSILGLETDRDWRQLMAMAGVTAEDFDYLCGIFAQKDNTAIITGFSLQRYANGMNSMRWINRLAALTGNENLLYYGKPSKEGLESPCITPAKRIPIAEIPKRLSENFFDLIIVVAANPCITYPESAIWVKALATTPLIVADVRESETTAHADVFLRVAGMFGQDDVQGSYFFNDGIRIRTKPFLTHHHSDAHTAVLLSQRLGIDLSIKKAGEIARIRQGQRKDYSCNALELMPPLSPPAGHYRLITLSHPLYLNSQVHLDIAQKDTFCYVSKEVAASEKLTDGQLIRIKNHLGFFEAPCRITTTLQGAVIMTYKNRPLYKNWPNYVVESRCTDAESGLAYYDTFVQLEKA